MGDVKSIIKNILSKNGIKFTVRDYYDLTKNNKVPNRLGLDDRLTHHEHTH